LFRRGAATWGAVMYGSWGMERKGAERYVWDGLGVFRQLWKGEAWYGAVGLVR